MQRMCHRRAARVFRYLRELRAGDVIPSVDEVISAGDGYFFSRPKNSRATVVCGLPTTCSGGPSSAIVP